MLGPPPDLHSGATEDDIHDGWAPARDAEAASDSDVRSARGLRFNDISAGTAAIEGAA